MAQKSQAMLRVLTGRGIIPRPTWLERLLTAFDKRPVDIELSSLSDQMLDDIGVTLAEVEAEMRRPAWDAPLHWRRA